MLRYSDLTAGQRKFVDLVELHFPNITTEITHTQIKEIHEFFIGKRAEHKNFKVAKALWIVTNNYISRGLYRFPGTNGLPPDIVDYSPQELAYRDELEKLGIKPKN